MDLASLKVGASRTHGSALAATTSFTLGATSTGRITCSCLQCQASSGTAATTTAAKAAAGALPADYTDLIKKSKRISTDALLAGGNRWFHTAGASGEVPSAVAKKTITYSFIESASGLNGTDANGFQALNGEQRDRVRDAVEYLSSVIDVSFTEVASGGDLQYGSNAQANSGATPVIPTKARRSSSPTTSRASAASGTMAPTTGRSCCTRRATRWASSTRATTTRAVAARPRPISAAVPTTAATH